MPKGRKILILSAAMGAGHDGVAAELGRRLAAEGVEAEVVDILRLLPLGLGSSLRRGYGWMIRSAPWLYAAIYKIFFVSERAPSTSPLTLLAAGPLRELVRLRAPEAVVSTFHLAAQVTGHLRERDRLDVPSVVIVTDFAAHRLWLHPGNDRYLCADAVTALTVAEATGRPAFCHAPLVRPEFLKRDADTARAAARGRARLGIRVGDRPVLVSAGAWGVGQVEETARVLAASGRYLPVVLCGRSDSLLRRLRDAGTGLALGWCDDMADVFAAAYAMVDNAAGLTCREAFAAGVPVVSYRPIAGHGRDGALAMARAGLSLYARNAAELVEALDRLDGTPERAGLVARGAALFSAASAESLLGRPPG
jgi:UDP-N-acetylglucosamine:LPS N-acetylglucosamine transferase